MGKRLSNAMEAGEKLSPPRKRISLRPSIHKDEKCNETDVDMDYEPIRFLRCHSKTKRDIADLSTQVWYCEFEPNIKKPDKTTEYFATCGGNSVCVIDASAQDVPDIERKYFSPDMQEMFYTLSWTTVQGQSESTNILAVAGACRKIHMIHPETNTRFLIHNVVRKGKKDVISSLKFDKCYPNILYCAIQEEVYVYDIGTPEPPNFVTELTLLHTLQARSEIVTLAISMKPHMLLAAANDGLYGWVTPHLEDAENAEAIKFKMPASETAAESGTSMVDSVVCLSNGQVAAKCALHGQIYVWDLAQVLASGSKSGHKVVPSRSLRWSNTDNYFMNIGFAPGSSLLGCGDDKGRVWIYDLSKNSNEPAVILDWPTTEDQYLAKSKKLRANVYDIVVDKVSFDWSGKHMVAVMSNNMVCVWKRVA